MPEETKRDQVIELRKKGLSFGQIRKILGIKRPEICAICREAGLSNREILKELMEFKRELQERLAKIEERLKMIEEKLKR